MLGCDAFVCGETGSWAGGYGHATFQNSLLRTPDTSDSLEYSGHVVSPKRPMGHSAASKKSFTMSSIVKLRVLICTLGIVAAATLGCQQSSRTQPANGGADDGASVAKPNGDEQTMPDPANADPPTSGAPEIMPHVPSQVPEVMESSTTLGIGDPAPALSIDRCVTGEPIDKLDPGQVYVIEFWATWCPPCRTSMPHLSQLQQQYGNKVQFVGVTRETEDTVRSFLAEEESAGRTWAEVVKYRLVIDRQAATDVAYMRAAGQTGIPTAFIVGRDGVVEWIGHPMSMDEPLAKIVANDWDREAAVAQFKQQTKLKEMSSELNNLMRAGSWDQSARPHRSTRKRIQPDVSIVESEAVHFREGRANGRGGQAARNWSSSHGTTQWR